MLRDSVEEHRIIIANADDRIAKQLVVDTPDQIKCLSEMAFFEPGFNSLYVNTNG
jgi:hypothetical protein